MFAPSGDRPMTRSLRVLALLLGYPDARLRSCLPQMKTVLQDECALSEVRRLELDALIDALAHTDPLDAEAAYVDLFDRGRATCLHLFEHVHGDSRERGPAMIDLGRTYERAGLVLREGELPDYLPAVLEFASTQPPREARDFLAEMAHILNAILGALRQRNSAYAGVLAALLELAGENAQPVAPVAEGSLDESWAEPPVFDGCLSLGQARPGAPQAIRVVRKTAGPGANL